MRMTCCRIGWAAACLVMVIGPIAGASESTPPPADPEIKPRLEVHIPSVTGLVEALQGSNAGVLMEPLRRGLLEKGASRSEGVDVEKALGLVEQVESWPDTSLRVATFAPDLLGRPRWLIRVDWPVDTLRERVAALLESPAAETLLEGVTVGRMKTGAGYKLTLEDEPLAYLLPADEECSVLASHGDLEFPNGLIDAEQADDDRPADVLACRLNLARTEKDTGASGLSGFSAVTAVEYRGGAGSEGNWTEEVRVLWPPVSGLGAKALFGQLRDTFFVPETAFGAAAFNTEMAKGMLEQMAGFGPQMVMGAGGTMTMMGETGPGPIATGADSETCITILPGTGFLPFPDIVVQLQAERPEELIESIRKSIKQINKSYRQREQREPWHETSVLDRTVFWSEGGGQVRGAMMPMVLRPMLMVTQEKDAKDRDRDILVVAWTSTAPEGLAERWLRLPRHEQARYVPTKRKTNGEIWVNWSTAYKWIVPYANLGLSSAGIETLLPASEDIKQQLTDARITAKLKYAGLTVDHEGPLPAGAVLVPAMAGISMAPDDSGGSDLARERLAGQRLKVLYHHAKLFRKDVGRWPAELGELDGYIDFAGHPELLRLRLSPKKRWTQWLEGLAEAAEQEPKREVEEEEAWYELDTKLYVIHWGEEDWTLGFAPDTFDHLERLYIDQEGEIHRVPKAPSTDTKEGKSTENAAADTDAASDEESML